MHADIPYPVHRKLAMESLDRENIVEVTMDFAVGIKNCGWGIFLSTFQTEKTPSMEIIL